MRGIVVILEVVVDGGAGLGVVESLLMVKSKSSKVKNGVSASTSVEESKSLDVVVGGCTVVVDVFFHLGIEIF